MLTPAKTSVQLGENIVVNYVSTPNHSNDYVSFCFVLFCFVLFCFVLFCFVLFCFVLFCFVLFCFVLFCFVLFCFVLFCFCLLINLIFVYIYRFVGNAADPCDVCHSSYHLFVCLR